MERPTTQATLCIPLVGETVLLGMKKRGFGCGKYNGFGGKIKAGETIEEATIRELREESGLGAAVEHLQKVAEIDFYFPYRPQWDQTVHIYTLAQFSGNPKETEEMAFRWFRRKEVPYHQMWDDDKYWLPLVLEGKYIKAAFTFKEKKGENLVDYKQMDVL